MSEFNEIRKVACVVLTALAFINGSAGCVFSNHTVLAYAAIFALLAIAWRPR
ncbi:MAG: hypothetical protein LLG20_18310 [Acidobacteriales bacterium]|nr:hypothetical protein [Terriglobales bacterium]